MTVNPFAILSQIAEQRIIEAQEKGEFDNLPGQGHPLQLEDSSHIPPELRMSYKVLKNANCLPPEIADRKEAGNLLDLLDNCPDEKEQLKAMTRLRLLMARMTNASERHCALFENDSYYQKILSRLEAHEREKSSSN